MESFFAGIMEAEALARLRGAGSPRALAEDWRRGWFGDRDARFPTLSVFPFSYPREAAMFDERERVALRDERDLRWGANAARFTTDVYRHPEYRDAIRKYNPRTVFAAR